MFKFTALILFIISLSAFNSCGGGGGSGSSDTQDPDGGPCNSINKITGGTVCDPFFSPVIAVVGVNSRGNGVSLCSGTIITNSKILTAAHCFSSGASGYRVVGGEDIDVPVTSIVVHPAGLDVAVVTVSEVELGISETRTPFLESIKIEVGDSVTAFGYGKSDTPDTFPLSQLPDLKAVDLIVDGIFERLFSTDFNSSGGAICQGDSGGPIILNKSGTNGIAGITILTFQGCRSGSSSGYLNTQIPEVLDFIKSEAQGIKIR